jgi:GNAT superfamily N-acetyltransferase
VQPDQDHRIETAIAPPQVQAEPEPRMPRPELRRGTLRDYHALAEHHYRAGTPATATRVLVLEDPRPTAMDRFTQRPATPAVIAVLVESLPSLSCRLRDYALHERFGSHLDPRSRARLLNDELRCISRVVVDPRYRGAGLAVRLVREALRTATTPWVEALAAMGRVNPFFERGGMTAYRRPPHPFDQRLTDALAALALTPHHLATPDHILTHLNTLPEPRRRWFLRELHHWYRKNAGRAGVSTTDPRAHLLLARERLKLEPVYYLFDRRSSTPEEAV